MQLLGKILAEGGVDLDKLDSHGYAAIHYVVMRRRHRKKQGLLELLVIGGADVDLPTSCRDKYTPLHLAVEVCGSSCTTQCGWGQEC